MSGLIHSSADIRKICPKPVCIIGTDMNNRIFKEAYTTLNGIIDAAYNNMGIHAAVRERLADTDGEDFDHVIAVNLRGVWNAMKYELIEMEKTGSGAIVNCSSQGGLVGIPCIGAYNASKHARWPFRRNRLYGAAPVQRLCWFRNRSGMGDGRRLYSNVINNKDKK